MLIVFERFKQIDTLFYKMIDTMVDGIHLIIAINILYLI